jgi:hypothetical protein
VNELSSAVTVWPALSWLVHVTVAPTATVIVAGLKLKPAIETALPPADGADAGATDAWADGAADAWADGATTGCVAGAGDEAPEQAAVAKPTANVRAVRRV